MRKSHDLDERGILLYLDGDPPGRETDYLGVVNAACDAGWTTLYIQYRGMWDSGGRFSLENSLHDIRSAVRFMVANPTRPIAIAGYSFSGYGALVVGAEEPEISCIAAIDPADLAVRGRQLAESEEMLNEFREWSMSFIGPNKPFHTFDVDSLYSEHMALPEAATLASKAESLATKRLLIVSSNIEVHSPDRIPYVEPLTEGLRAANTDHLMTEFIDTDHDFTGEHARVQTAVSNWLNDTCTTQ